MSKDWFSDIRKMHRYYGVHQVVDKMDRETLDKFLKFRVDFIREELEELEDNMHDPEEVVDALIDICVVAIGTLESFGVDGHAAWDEVLKANMAKEVGVKESRPNPLGLPDLIKPDGWVGPVHHPNHGKLKK